VEGCERGKRRSEEKKERGCEEKGVREWNDIWTRDKGQGEAVADSGSGRTEKSHFGEKADTRQAVDSVRSIANGREALETGDWTRGQGGYLSKKRSL
jgi:hypothetical protein